MIDLIPVEYYKMRARSLDLSQNLESSRDYDINDFMEVIKNPISRTGVFPYSGAQISEDLPPDEIFQVYRSEKELNNPETLESFRLIPFTDEHEMIGNVSDGLTDASEKGVHGTTGENIEFNAPYLTANIKVFSEKLKNLIDNGKRELSIGYRCVYEKENGVYNGDKYDFVQREIRGNHLALVGEGRSGHDVAVLDHFKFTFDTKDLKMPDYQLEGTNEEDMSIAGIREMLAKISKHLESMSESKDEFLDDEEAERMNENINGLCGDEIQPKDFVKKAEVTDEDEDKEKEKEEKKEDAKDEEEKKSDKKDGMDSRLTALQNEIKQLKQSAIKTVLDEISKRDSLANLLSPHVGTFDHANKTLEEVATYGVKKLGLKCKTGHEESVLSGFLAAARKNSAVIAQDSNFKSDNVDAYLKGVK